MKFQLDNKKLGALSKGKDRSPVVQVTFYLYLSSCFHRGYWPVEGFSCGLAGLVDAITFN